jgi:hypothetical protein
MLLMAAAEVADGVAAIAVPQQTAIAAETKYLFIKTTRQKMVGYFDTGQTRAG